MPPTTALISPTTLPHPLLRKAAILSFLPALPLCITHGALSQDLVPALGLLPLFFSAAASTFLLVRARRLGKGKQPRRDGVEGLDPEGADDAIQASDAEDEDEVEEGVGEERGGESVLTHRIVVFVVDAVLAAALMVVLVFTWIGTGHVGRGNRPELAMLAAYATVPLLVNL
jgi:hypothetical protein